MGPRQAKGSVKFINRAVRLDAAIKLINPTAIHQARLAHVPGARGD